MNTAYILNKMRFPYYFPHIFFFNIKNYKSKKPFKILFSDNFILFIKGIYIITRYLNNWLNFCLRVFLKITLLFHL